MRWMRIVVQAMLGAILLGGASNAEDAADTPVEVKRIALVIGNADYTKAARLPGSLIDADEVGKTLGGLGFEVTKAKNVVTRSEFLHVYLLPFLARIEPGSLVVFYFSGHGLSHNGEGYLLPLEFPVPTHPNNVPGTFLSVTAIQDLVVEKHPSAAILILDACRTLTSIIGKADGTSGGAQSKGLPEPQPAPQNILIWYSSALGAVSLAAPEGRMSYYSAALVEHLPEPGAGIDLVRKKTRIQVMSATGVPPQTPWSNESSSAEIWLNPTGKTLNDLREAWAAAKGTREKVSFFLSLYGATPFAAVARKWLETNPVDPPARGSIISPAAPERIWNETLTSPSTASGSAPTALESGGSLTMPRTLDWQEYVARREALRAGSEGTRPRTVKEAFERQGSLITTENVQAWESPATAGSPVSLPPGSKLKIALPSSTMTDASEWLSVTKPQSDEKLWIKLPTKMEERDIGRPVLQKVAPPPSSGPAVAVDESFITATLDEVRGKGKTVNWVSIATPPTSDPRQQKIYSLRAAYAERLLVKQGVPPDLITIVEGAADNASNVRLRLFGR